MEAAGRGASSREESGPMGEECSVALVRGSECTAAAAQHGQQMKLAQGITKSGSTHLIIS